VIKVLLQPLGPFMKVDEISGWIWDCVDELCRIVEKALDIPEKTCYFLASSWAGKVLFLFRRENFSLPLIVNHWRILRKGGDRSVF
jgi:hypothetical protein